MSAIKKVIHYSDTESDQDSLPPPAVKMPPHQYVPKHQPAKKTAVGKMPGGQSDHHTLTAAQPKRASSESAWDHKYHVYDEEF